MFVVELGDLRKTLRETFRVRFCTEYVEVITKIFEPHLNHCSLN